MNDQQQIQNQNEKFEGVSSFNGEYTGATALTIRLETQRLIAQIEYFLRGLEPNDYYDEKSQSFQTKLIKLGDPMANSKGIQALLNYCRSLINPQIVQGNYKKDEYLAFIEEKRIEVASMTFINFYEWELKEDNAIAEITNFILNMIEPFMSRTIDNEERKSYAQTMKMSETNTIQPKKGLAGIFGG